MKSAYLKKLHKKSIVLVNETILQDDTMLKLLSSMYDHPSYLCKSSLYPHWLSKCEKLELPENLTIEGTLNIQWYNTKLLPKNLKVDVLDIRFTKIKLLDHLNAKTIIISRPIIIDPLSVRFNKLYTTNIQHIINYKLLSVQLQRKIVTDFYD